VSSKAPHRLMGSRTHPVGYRARSIFREPERRPVFGPEEIHAEIARKPGGRFAAGSVMWWRRFDGWPDGGLEGPAIIREVRGYDGRYRRGDDGKGTDGVR